MFASMPTCKWYLPTLAEVMQIAEPTDLPQSAAGGDRPEARLSTASRAQREWYSAITSLNVLLDRLLENIPPIAPDDLPSPIEGIVISGPLPVLGRIGLIRRFSSWVLTGGAGQPDMPNPFQLLPAADIATSAELSTVSLPLLPDDPLGPEPFCLVLTSEFSLMMSLHVSLGKNSSSPTAEEFMFSFTPEVVWQGWRSLRSRLELTTPHVIGKLDSLIEQFAPITPDYRLIADFTRLMLAHFPDVSTVPHGTTHKRSVIVPRAVANQAPPSKKKLNVNLAAVAADPQPKGFFVRSGDDDGDGVAVNASREQWNESVQKNRKKSSDNTGYAFDTELLQAIAHEVRTPLTTIRTLTRLLLKQKSLPEIVLRRLEMIDHECTRQIDRFSLIFRAAELQEKPDRRGMTPLAKISLIHVLQHNAPQWRQQAEQRNLTLEVLLPKTLPMVLSDPMMLEQVLSGLVDQLTHALPAGSHIQIRATLAGSQIKLQVFSKPPLYGEPFGQVTQGDEGYAQKKVESMFSSTLKSIGQLLMFQPETGNLSLNPDVTKNLFHILGGKFTIRQYSHQGEVLTIFLPLEETGT